MMYYGRNGYVDCTRKIVSTTRKIVAGLKKVKGVRILGDPEVSVVAISECKHFPKSFLIM